MQILDHKIQIDLELYTQNLDLDQISRFLVFQTLLSLRSREFGAFSFVPLSEFVGRPSWTKSGQGQLGLGLGFGLGLGSGFSPRWATNKLAEGNKRKSAENLTQISDLENLDLRSRFRSLYYLDWINSAYNQPGCGRSTQIDSRFQIQIQNLLREGNLRDQYLRNLAQILEFSNRPN